MFLKKTRSNNYTYLSFVETFREKGKVKHRTLFKLGRLDQLKINGGLKRLADSFQRLISTKKNFSIDSVQELKRVNWGAEAVYRSLWNKFSLDTILQKAFAHKRIKFNYKETIFLEVISRLIKPSSKLKLYYQQEKFHGVKEISLQHLYRVLDLLAEKKDAIEEEIFFQNVSLFNMNVDVVFYDVTTLYFESANADSFRDFGYSKDCKFGEVQIVLGLLVDMDGRPIGFDVYPGNTFEGKTLEKALYKLKKRFQIREVIIVADRGINSKLNLKQIKDMGFDYIVGCRLKSLKTSFKRKALDISKYKPINNEGSFKYYFLDHPNEINSKEKALEEKICCLWSKKRAEKDFKDRQRMIKKALKLLETKSYFSKRGASKYIKNESQSKGRLDEEKIKEDAKWDGFYAIQCSKNDISASEITEAYHRLWKIEESFRIFKTNLKIRPIFHWTEKRIKGHLVLCFISFLLQRTLELKLKQKGYQHSADKIREAVDKLELSVLKIEDQKFYLRSAVEGLSNQILRMLKIKIPKDLSLPEEF